MAVHLARPRRQRVAFGSTLASRRRRPSAGLGLIRMAFGSLLVALVLGLLFAWQQATSPTTVLLLGGSILLWAVMSFGSERPK